MPSILGEMIELLIPTRLGYDAGSIGRALLRDKYDLTRSEFRTLEYVVEGMSNKEIGDALGIDTDTVRARIKSICTKMDVPNRTRAAAEACSFGVRPRCRNARETDNP